jgi:hypothetical protein
MLAEIAAHHQPAASTNWEFCRRDGQRDLEGGLWCGPEAGYFER